MNSRATTDGQAQEALQRNTSLAAAKFRADAAEALEAVATEQDKAGVKALVAHATHPETLGSPNDLAEVAALGGEVRAEVAKAVIKQ